MADPRVPSPYYNDPYLADIASNIGKAFSVGNMGKSLVERAQADHLRLESDKLARENASRTRGANLIRTMNPGDDVRELAATGYEGDVPVAQTAGTTLYTIANNANSTTEQRAGAALGDGHVPTKDTAYSAADRELVAARDARDAAQRTAISAGPGYAAVAESRRNHDQELQFKKDTRWDKPENVAPGDANFHLSDDPRFPATAPSGSIPAPKPLPADHLVKIADPNNPTNVSGIFAPTADAIGKPVAPGQPRADHMVLTPDPNHPGQTMYAQATAGLPAPDTKTIDTKEAEANAIAYSALDSIGATGVSPDGHAIMSPEFIALYGAKLPAAKEAAVKARQTNKNPGAAEAAFLDALGVPAGRMFKPSGTPIIGSGPAAMVPRPPGAAAAAPAVAPPVESLPASVAGALKEGVHTTFGNGQTWTKQNGVPVRVK